ncbi:MAG: hypothetical protein KDD06_00930 [Phaeodactylibacter sp.]|nr:hypothetical protein [Phaeodactylibacter sp.]MCB9265193.1 hypothetical protein [Lewinellaceae bacterium]MCB9285945.1 hypothetical protein [Lewinellaceae bacterium]
MYQNLPFIEIYAESRNSWEGWDAIHQEARHAIHKLGQPRVVIAVECYHGTLDGVNFQELKKRLRPDASCLTSHLFRESEELQELIRRRMADENRPGKFTGLSVTDYFDPQRLLAIQHSINSIKEGVVLIYGVGASLVCEPGLLIYADMSHWETQQRLRRGDIGNLGLKNAGASFERKYEIAFFNDWQVCNQLKRELISHCDYFLETNNWAKPKLATGDIVRRGLEQATRQPIKMAPFFDPELWEQLHEHNGHSTQSPPLEWWFSCVPEEDNLLFRFNGLLFEAPLLNLAFYKPESFLGREVVRRFGTYLPVRFNFIDTTEHQDTEFLLNPVTQEIVDSLGCRYRQATGYYMLEAQPGAKLELADPEQHPQALKVRELGLQRHDFVQIPPGIPYRAGKRLTALQINTAPEIFSVKVPPVAAQERRGYAFSDIVRHPEATNGQEEVLSNDVIMLARNWFSQDITFHTHGGVNILLLVAGQAVVVESPSDAFRPFLARYGETFIIPAQIGAYRIRPLGVVNQPHALLRATVADG